MSNHIHIICKAENDNLSDVIRDFKKHTSKLIIKTITTSNESRRHWLIWMFHRSSKVSNAKSYKVWKSGNGAEEVITNRFMDQKINYIHQNPVKNGLVFKDYHYLYSSAGCYAGMGGLVEVTIP